MARIDKNIWQAIQDKVGSALFGQHLSLSPIGWVVVTIVSTVTAIVLYFGLQQGLQKKLANVVREVDVIRSVCAQIPAVYQKNCLNKTKDNESSSSSDSLGTELTWHIFSDAGIIDRRQLPSVVDYESELQSDKALEYLNEHFDDEQRFRELGPELLIKISRLLCNPGATSDDIVEGKVNDPNIYKNRITHLVAKLQPHAFQTAYEDDDNPIKPTKFRFSIPKGVTDSEIVEWMFYSSGSTAKGSNGYAWGTEKNLCDHQIKIQNEAVGGSILLTDSDQWRVLDGSEKLALWFIGQIRSTPEYRDARFLLTVFTGPEQFAIFIVGFFAMILTIFRLMTALRMQEIADGILKRRSKRPVRGDWPLLNFLQKVGERVAAQSPSERGYWKDQLMDEISSARWPTRLALATLPAIGFFGTVRGIMNSLSGADAIVWATSDSERAQAISALSGDLGLAFATTMLALGIGIVLSFLSAFEVRRFENAILPLFAAHNFELNSVEKSPDNTPSAPSIAKKITESTGNKNPATVKKKRAAAKKKSVVKKIPKNSNDDEANE